MGKLAKTQMGRSLQHESEIRRSLPFPKPLRFPSWISVEVETAYQRSERLRIFAGLSLKRIKAFKP